MIKKLMCISVFMIFMSSAFAMDIQSHQVSINNQKIHYYQVGNSKTKPNLIMLTGIGTTANFWPKDFINSLSSCFNVYILDYRGLNTDQDTRKIKFSINDLANDVNKFSKQMKLEHVSLLAWSMGGTVALQTVFDKPSQYEHLYMISPALPVGPHVDSSSKLKPAPKFNGDDDIYSYVFNNNLYKYLPDNLNTEKSRFIKSDIKTLFPSPNYYAAEKKARDAWASNQKSYDNFLNLSIPTTIFLSSNDAIEHIDKMQKTISKLKHKSQVSVIYLNKSGHAIDWDQSEKLASMINTIFTS